MMKTDTAEHTGDNISSHSLHTIQANSHVTSQNGWVITLLLLSYCDSNFLNQTGDQSKQYQSYQCISASGPGSYSWCWQAEGCQRNWKMMNLCHTAPRWTGSGCLSGEMEIRAWNIQGKSRPAKKSTTWALPRVDFINVSIFHCRFFALSDTKWLSETSLSFKMTLFHSVLNKGVTKCTSLKNH